MGRHRRRSSDRTLDDLVEWLYPLPIWAGPAVALAAYVLFRYLAPPILAAPGNDLGKYLADLTARLAWFAPFAVLICWVLATVRKLTTRGLFNRQTAVESLRNLSWPEFEVLVGEAFRRQGYGVVETGKVGPDGGVDLVLRKDGVETLIQCKRWKEWSVGVTTIRELYGVMAARGSTHGIVVSSGKFTSAARLFADGKSLTLVDGPMLAKLVSDLQPQSAPTPRPQPVPPIADSVVCPQCGATMTLRTARKGSQSGNQFWGCTRYPACRGIRAYKAGR
jgi:restriction system protein